MIDKAYHLVNKGSWRALSLILAIALTLCFFFNINEFATQLRTAPPVWVIFILWATVILWIHGIGFEIRAAIWKGLFFPYVGYIVGIIALVQHFLLPAFVY
ncbi:cyd operon protein YbgE [Avibacterium endocarditidis]|uniref:Cyd operon protein YbgE n=2 Tax=Avibacterium TaxID=292486 RepID=A0A379B092_AVIGA|nr:MULTISPECIES: cyd operon protein YbgE [Avibacterium]POY42733.1 cyd operon protein YbgE [Avibacterium endocarditidis]POY44267.1 cyd operon protein YbgE [Avibacterium gallinarum]TDP29200.1 cyd operon protein YbgE [Avibacterium gallinarum]SUB28316.1 cyd operon protein YbgE [Avibacterium gallinarum]